MARPDWSTAAQKVAEGQEIEVRWRFPSTSTRVHVRPAHWRMPPELSVAAQKVVEGQETPVGVGPIVVADACPGSMRDGPDQVRPFHRSDPPESSTAVQNVVVGQETSANEDESPNELGMVHCSPFHSEIPPDVDMQNEGVTHEMADTDPQSPLVPVQAFPLKAKAFPSASTAAQ